MENVHSSKYTHRAAYGRVNRDYLCQVLQALSFLRSVVSSVIAMMANSLIKVDINGSLPGPIPNKRDLKQGDPLSPVLYSLVLEPFLRSLDQGRKVCWLYSEGTLEFFYLFKRKYSVYSRRD